MGFLWGISGEFLGFFGGLLESYEGLIGGSLMNFGAGKWESMLAVPSLIKIL